MTHLSSFTDPRRRSALFVTVVAAVFAVSLACLSAADAKSDKETKSQKKAASSKTEKKTNFSGADLYAMHCNRCHPERYATERTSSQWTTIMLHMRVRANLPAEQAKAILKFLQEDAGK